MIQRMESRLTKEATIFYTPKPTNFSSVLFYGKYSLILFFLTGMHTMSIIACVDVHILKNGDVRI